MDSNRRDLLRDRRWMNYKNASDRRKLEYVDGVNTFLDFAFANVGNNEKIRCPCVNCYLGSFHDRKVVFYHLLARGIIKDYNPWTQHGEDEDGDESSPCEDHMPIVHDQHPPVPHRENKVRDSHEEKFEDEYIDQRENENGDVPEENDEDGNGDTPDIPPSVWRYVNNIGMMKTGADINQEKDEGGDQDVSTGEYNNFNDVNGADLNLEKDEDGDQGVSIGEDDNFNDVNYCDSSPNQSSGGMNFMTVEAGQVTTECESSEAVQAANSGRRKKSFAHRGRTRGIKWNKEREKNSGPVKVELPSNLGRVVGRNARQFITEASCLLKQTLPPDVVKWKDLKPDDVAKLLEKVKKRFVFPNESHVDEALLWQFKRWFRSWRSELRRCYYNKYETYEERIANRPPYVKEAQWKWLVDYWSSEKFKKLSEINSRIRNNQRNMTCLGQKSIARYTYELEKKQSQQDSDLCPVYLKLFESQKKKSDGTWINKETEDAYNELFKLHKKQLEEHGFDNLMPIEAFTRVLGNARTRNLLGLGQSPVPCEGSSKRKRQLCSDKSIVEATVRARVEAQYEQKWAEREAQIEKKQSVRETQMRAEMREQIRLIWEELASSSTNASENCYPFNPLV